MLMLSILLPLSLPLSKEQKLGIFGFGEMDIMEIPTGGKACYCICKA
jgi:hypothetical protein